MTLAQLQIFNVRNIATARVKLNSHINLIFGENGSGKTSFLEALYLLSSGHSFRTREIATLIQTGKDKLTVFAKTDDNQTISIQKSASLATIAQINGVSCANSSELAAFLPCQVFYQDIFQLIDAGPAFRRSLLDWGMFHVEQNYLALWKNYRRTLKQRNSLLKQRTLAAQLQPWNKLLGELAAAIDDYRQQYFTQLITHFEQILKQLTNIQCSLNYYKGWDKKNEGISLAEVLQANFAKDAAYQFTRYGAHNADLHIIAHDNRIKNFLSRGEQKMILFALKFAQALLLNNKCLFLIDDITAELDDNHVIRLIEFINGLDGQFYISLQKNDFLRFSSTFSNFDSVSLIKGAIEI